MAETMDGAKDKTAADVVAELRRLTPFAPFDNMEATMREAADLLSAQSAEIERTRAALCEIDAGIFIDNGDVTSLPVYAVRAIIARALSTAEPARGAPTSADGLVEALHAVRYRINQEPIDPDNIQALSDYIDATLTRFHTQKEKLS